MSLLTHRWLCYARGCKRVGNYHRNGINLGIFGPGNGSPSAIDVVFVLVLVLVVVSTKAF